MLGGKGWVNVKRGSFLGGEDCQCIMALGFFEAFGMFTGVLLMF